MPIWRRLLDEQLDLVAAESRRTMAARLVLSMVTAVLIGLNRDLATATAWLACMALGEAWTWPASAAPAAGRPNSILQRLSYAGTMLAVTLVWSSAALIYWRAGGTALRLVAVAILFGQMIHAQCFAFRSKLALAILAGLPALLLIGLTIGGGGFHGVPLATAAISMALSTLYVGVSAVTNLRAARALEAAQSEAVAANHAKSAFLAMMSHELRTPLNGVLGMAHALKASRLNPAQTRQVDLLIGSGDGLMAILNDILDVSKIEAGRLELEACAFDIVELGERVHDMWRDLAAAKGVRLVYDVAAGAPHWLMGDPTRLRQIMLNLTSNALKFTEAGEVRLAIAPLTSVSGAPDAERFEICVSDTGIGIAEEQCARLFQSFSQAEASTARRFGGTGLGLAICKQLTELMGGEIQVQSQLGRGSMFRVVLELPRAEPPAAEAVSVGEDGIAGRRILVAEDNAINQAVARAILEAVGARLEVANDGAEALDMLRAGGFDVVLMDVHMPRMDGLEALARIRAGETGDARLPVIALTADAMPGENDKLRAFGFDDVQPKPIQPMALIGAIAEACAARQATPGLAAAS